MTQQEKISTIEKRLNEHIHISKIAREVGISKSRVFDYIKSYNMISMDLHNDTNSKNRRLTPQILSTVESLFELGKDCKEISEEIDIPYSITCALYDLYHNKYSCKQLTFEILKQVVELMYSGLHRCEVAERMGISRNTISVWIYRYNVYDKFRKTTRCKKILYRVACDSETRKKLQRYFDDGMTYQAIADKLGVPISRVVYWNEIHDFRAINSRESHILIDKINKAKELKKLGFTYAQIGELINMHRSTVSKWLKKECL